MFHTHPLKLIAAGIAFVIFAVGAVISPHAADPNILIITPETGNLYTESEPETPEFTPLSHSLGFQLSLVIVILVACAVWLTTCRLEMIRHHHHPSPSRPRKSRRN